MTIQSRQDKDGRRYLVALSDTHQVLATRDLAIRTDYWAKPIPDRKHDWDAIDWDTYDGAPDSSTRNQIGWGATEAEAIQDLLEQLSEAWEEELWDEFDARCEECGRQVEPEHDLCAECASEAAVVEGKVQQILEDWTQ